MNSFGNLFKVQIFGESHGECVGIVIDGCPAGLHIEVEDFKPDLERRKGGKQIGTTPRQEADVPNIKSGIYNGLTTGAPIMIYFDNNQVRSQDYDQFRKTPRPGHADFVANKKYGGYADYRGGGHFSARLTTGIVAAGVIAKKLLSDISINAEVIEVGGESDIELGIQKAIEAKDSVGAIITCRVNRLPIGIGAPYFEALDARIAHAMFCIPAVKGVSFGAGFQATKMYGSEHNDAIINMDGHTKTNHAGGVVGGISNGNELVFDIAFKPTASTPKAQESLNINTGELETFSIKGRHDLCVALRAPVIVEAATAITLVDLMLQEGSIRSVLT